MRYFTLIILSLLSFAILADEKDYSLVIKHKNGSRTIVSTIDVDSFLIEKTVLLTGNGNCYESASNWYVNIENPLVSKYLNETDYSDLLDDYSVTYMPDYCDYVTTYRLDQPRGVEVALYGGSNQKIILSFSADFSGDNDTINVADDVKEYIIYNLIPGKRYYYKILQGESEIRKSHFTTMGQVRMMHLPSVRNVRDIGGWPTDDGGHLRYGLIFRGGELNTSSLNDDPFLHEISSEDSLFMHDKMNIRLDMDLRDYRDMNLYDSISENDKNYTPLGSDVEYKNEMVNYKSDGFSQFSYWENYRWGRCIRYILNTLKTGHSAYFHCTFGADRTGMLAVIIEALCGVSESDINKDYELTSCYRNRKRTRDYLSKNIKLIKSQLGNTLKNCTESFCKRIGLTQKEIDEFRNYMIEY